MSVCVKRPTIAVPAMSALTASAFSRKATLSAKMNAVIQKRNSAAKVLVALPHNGVVKTDVRTSNYVRAVCLFNQEQQILIRLKV